MITIYARRDGQLQVVCDVFHGAASLGRQAGPPCLADPRHHTDTGLSQKNELKLREAGTAAHLEKSSLTLDNRLDALIQVINGVLGTSRS